MTIKGVFMMNKMGVFLVCLIMSTMSYGSTWSSVGTFDLGSFSSNSELVEYLSQFTVDVVADGEDSETGVGSYCVYESGIDHIDVKDDKVTLVIKFSFNGTPGFCNESDLTQVWKDLSNTTGVKLDALIKD